MIGEMGPVQLVCPNCFMVIGVVDHGTLFGCKLICMGAALAIDMFGLTREAIC